MQILYLRRLIHHIMHMYVAGAYLHLAAVTVETKVCSCTESLINVILALKYSSNIMLLRSLNSPENESHINEHTEVNFLE